MSKFFKPSGETITNKIRNLAPTESVVLELSSTTESYTKAMSAIASIATQLGYTIRQQSMKAVPCDVNVNEVYPLIRVTRVS